MDIERASAAESALIAAVPVSWDIEARNTEIRPGKEARYKVVATSSSGLCIVAGADTGKFFVTINNGPGIVESVANREFTGVSNDRGWDDAETAFSKLKALIVARNARVTAQFASLI